ncbi:Hypothetical predicted protein [Paramuricea clavata]|uniref:Uncharacterized protein n=1 Tax=Paramuricea clavata TaxID=317549 RepID=A0A7D9F0V0_PARCT|nr:Hypothetical predicted protein [Paramuricea clavata]
MFATLLCFTVYALSLLHAKPVTNDPAPNFLPATFPATTPRPLGCEVNGKFYSPGEIISSEIDKQFGWCHGTYCSEDGNVIPWDDFNCGATTPLLPATTAPFPTTPKTTTPRTTTRQTTTQRATTSRISTPLTTFPPATTPPRPLGCEVNGKFYSPGEIISSEIDKQFGWCHGTYCGEDGNVIPWDDFNCINTTIPAEASTTPEPSSTPPSPITTSSYSSAIVEEASTLSPRATTAYTTVPRRLGCEYEGKFYAPGTEISKGSDGRGRCYGLICTDDGNITPWDDFNCGATTSPPITASHPSPTTTPSTARRKSTPKTTKPQYSSTPQTTRQSGCEYEGNFYSPGASFGEGTDGEGWCYGLYCDYDGNVIPWDNFECGTSTPLPSTTAPFPTTTFPLPTTVPKSLGCEVDGKFYSPGEEISSEIDKEIGWCYGTYCGEDGNVIPWNDFNCGTTTPLPATTAPFPTTTKSTTPRTTTPRTTTPMTSTPLTTFSVPTTALGCEVDGKFYSPGEEISSEIDKEIGWCYGTYCGEDGNVIPWNDFNCGATTPLLPATTAPFPTTTKPTTPRTTTPMTSTPLTTFSVPTTALGCEVDGKFYSPGEEISSEIDKEIGWCYGTYCGEDGNVIPWNDFNCGATTPLLPATTAPFPTTTKPTTPRTTTPMTSTPLTTFSVPTTALGCEVDGKFYSPGEEISSEIDKEIGWCYGTYCGEDGNVIPWNDFNCGTTTPLPSTTTPFPTTPKTTTPRTTPPRTTTPMTSTPLTTFSVPTTALGCEVDGKFYSPGEEISSEIDKEIGWCYGTYCGEDGNVLPWNDFNCGTTAPLPATTAPFPTTPKATTPRTTTPRTTTPRTTTPQTTTPMTSTTLTTFSVPTTALGCEVDGKFYSPGEEISSEIDKEIGWCYGTYCGEDGNVIPWNDFNCGTTTPLPATTAPFPTTPKTTTPRTTTPRTTTPMSSTPLTTFSVPTTALGCEVDGKFYSPGEEISSEIDKEIGWCYGTYCGEDGNVIPWNDFNCGTTNPLPSTTTPFSTTPKTTTPRTTTSRTTTPMTSTPLTTLSVPTTALRCEVDGKFYSPGDEISSEIDKEIGWCYGTYCGEDGHVIPWNDFNCGTITHTVPSSTPPPRITTEIRSTPRTSTTPEPSKEILPSTSSPKTPTLTSALPPSTPQSIGWCFFEGKYFENGDTISRIDFGWGWCSGWYCNDGKVDSWTRYDCPNPTTVSKSTPSAPSLQCYYQGIYYNEGEVVVPFEGSGDCEGMYCSGGVLVPYEGRDCGSTKQTNPPTTEPSPKPVFSTNTVIPEPSRCLHEGRYYEQGDLAPSGDNWCAGLICKDGKMISWENCEVKIETTNIPVTDASNATDSTLAQSTILSSITNPTSDSTTTTKPSEKRTTHGPELSRCFYEGRYYEEGDLVPSGNNWCSGLICKDGKMVSWENCEVKIETTNIPVTHASKATITQSTIPSSVTNPTSDSITTSKPSEMPTIQGPEPSRCFYEGRYYEEGDLVPSGNNWCSGLICNDGKMISWENCEVKIETTNIPVTDASKATDSTLTQSTIPNSITKPTSDSITTTKPSETPTTHGPELSRCVYEGRYYEEGDLVPSGNNWCSGLICKDGEMVLLENCEVKLQSTNLPITDNSKTTGSEPSETISPSSITNPTTSEGTTNPPDLTTTSITNLTTQTKETTNPPELEPCFHEEKYYEEGDIIPRDFNGDNWCSGWYCKGGQLIPVDCGDIISKEDTSSPKSVSPPITRGPESSLCYHEGRYYEEGDLAMSGNNWCSGLICNDGVMVLWNTCETKLQSTQTPGATILPKSTSKQPESTPTIPTSSTETPVTKTSSIHPTTKTLPYTTKITHSKFPDTTAKTSVSTTNIPDTTTKAPDSTTIFSDSTTRTTDTPTKREQTTPTQPPQTTKPEKQKCFYEGALYPPGEVTQGVLEDGRCYGVLCDISGVIIQWVTATCTRTEPPTTEIKNTLPGCVYGDKYYPPGRISRISDDTSWCLDVICTEEGKIVSINNMNCDEATTPKPTTAATTKPENTCLYNGMKYSPGVISEGVDENGWCYKVVCQENGELYLWGDWHCRYSRRSTTTAPLETTPSAPTTCTYNMKEYPVGEITRGNDASGWCYGVTCRNDGQIVLWGSFTCRKA